jgi:hypothetical protein
VFDDSFEHSVWNDSEEDRIIFILDVPHPELTAEQERGWVWSLEDGRPAGRAAAGLPRGLDLNLA